MGRQLEPEVMESAEEAAAYDELERLYGEILFQGFVESALRMGVTQGRVLDVGAGPGRIAIRLARLNPRFSIDAIDLSRNMLALAARNAQEAGVGERIRCSIGDAKRIPFGDQTFDLVLCHNMLHQLAEPLVALKEIKRITKPDGAILVRDVRRLPQPFMDLALPLYCLRYGATLRRLTYSSYRAGLRRREFKQLAKAAGISGARIRQHFITHVGLERPARPYVAHPLPPPPSRLFTRLAKSFYVSNPLPS